MAHGFFRIKRSIKYLRNVDQTTHFASYRAMSDIRTQTLNNEDAHLFLKNLFFSHQKKNNDYHLSKKVCTKAIDIYQSIEGTRLPIVINIFLRICLHFKHPHAALVVCPDIDRLLFDDDYDTHQLIQLKKNINISYPTLLKCCIKTNNFEKGKQIHRMLQRAHHPSNDCFTQTALIQLYGHFGDIETAEALLHAMDHDLVGNVTVGALMKVLIGQKLHSKALALYDQHSHTADDVLHLLAIKACIGARDVDKGRAIGAGVVDKGRAHEVELYNTLIDFYGHFRQMTDAWRVFNAIVDDDKQCATYNAMMKALMHNNSCDSALALFDRACAQSTVDDLSRIYALKACMNLQQWHTGEQLYADLTQRGTVRISNTHLANTCIDFFGAMRDMDRVLLIFESIYRAQKTSATLNVVMKALAHNGDSHQALEFYHRFYGLHNEISHALALNACIAIDNFHLGQHIVDTKLHHHTLHKQLSLMTSATMIEFYAHFKDIVGAHRVFEAVPMHRRDVILVSNMMQAYLRSADYDKVLRLYDEYSTLHDNICRVLALKACIECNAFEKGKQIHRDISESGNGRHSSIELQNALIDLYGTFGDLRTALQLFDAMPNAEKRIDTVNAMMNAYAQNCMDRDCVQLFDDIERVYRLQPSVISIAVMLKACTQCTMYHYAQRKHQQIQDDPQMQSFLSHQMVQINLIHLYGKCAMITKCEEIFEHIRSHEKHKYLQEIAVWNAMIKAYARNGDANKARLRLEEMISYTELMPDAQTFKILIKAYSHAHQEYEAKQLYETQIVIRPHLRYDQEIVTAMVDCYSRNGYIEDAYQLIQSYTQYGDTTPDNIANKAMWISLLSGCKTYNNRTIAQFAYDQIQQRFGTSPAVTVN